ncbi:MAG: 2-dehydropantoate 2-reductase N-terminal domain-containing protein, partial [Actinomycetota bacterium]
MERQRIAVIGAGSVGGVFAAHLSTVHDVLACVRRPFDRWRIESSEVPHEGPAQAVTDPAQLP